MYDVNGLSFTPIQICANVAQTTRLFTWNFFCLVSQDMWNDPIEKENRYLCFISLMIKIKRSQILCTFKYSIIFKSSYSLMFLKIGVLKNVVIFTWKKLCCSLFLIKLLAWRPVTLLKIDSNTGVFLWILLNF